MTRKVELIIDRDCPNVAAARQQLNQAFAAIGLKATWTEWDREAQDAPPYARLYGSPTVLVDERDVDGEATESDANSCRVYLGADGRLQGVPAVERIVAALHDLF